MRVGRRSVLLGLIAVAVAIVGLCWQRALTKAEVLARLLALPKNSAALRAAGVERRTMPLRIDGREIVGEVAFVHGSQRTAGAAARREPVDRIPLMLWLEPHAMVKIAMRARPPRNPAYRFMFVALSR